MVSCRAKSFSTKYHTFLTKRFDRDKFGTRIHSASAMTLLGYTDGVNNTDGVSYLELAEWISNNCIYVSENLKQMWQRIVFNIAVSNNDDHLRNHGFLFVSNGWTLSPAFDINPDENANGLKLNISENDNSLDYDLVLSVAPYFGLKNKEAKKLIEVTKSVVSSWREVAKKYSITRGEVDSMERAFRY